MVFYAAFNNISVISRRQFTLFMSSWVSPVLGWGSEVSYPRTLPRKNPEDPVWLEPRTPGLRVKHFTTEPRRSPFWEEDLGYSHNEKYIYEMHAPWKGSLMHLRKSSNSVQPAINQLFAICQFSAFQIIILPHDSVWRRMSGGTIFLFAFERRQPYYLLDSGIVRPKISLSRLIRPAWSCLRYCIDYNNYRSKSVTDKFGKLD